MKKQKKKSKKKAKIKISDICPNCGKQEAHFVPSSCGDSGFFICATGEGGRMTITEEQVQALWKNPYMLLQRKPDAKVYTIKPDTEWLKKLSCEQRRKFREQKEQELGLPEGSLAYSYEFWDK